MPTSIGGIPIRAVGIRIIDNIIDNWARRIELVNFVWKGFGLVDFIMKGVFGDGKKSSNKRNTYAALESMKNVLKRLQERNISGAVGSFNAFTIHARNSSSLRAMFLSLGGKKGVTAWNLVAGFLSLKSGHLMSRLAREGQSALILTLTPERVLILREKDARFSIGETFITRADLQVERDELHSQILSYMREAEADVVRATMPETISSLSAELIRQMENEEIDADDLVEILNPMPNAPAIFEEITRVLAAQGEVYANVEARASEMLDQIMGEPRARFQSLSRPGRSSEMDVGELINALVDFIYYTDNSRKRNGLVNFIRKTVTLFTFVLITRSGYVPETRETFQLAKDDMEKMLVEDFKLPFANVETTLSPLTIAELPMGEVVGDNVMLPAEPKYASSVYLRPPSEADLVTASKATALQAMNRIRKVRTGFPGLMIKQDAIFYWYILLLAQSDRAIAREIFLEDTTFENEECYDPVGTGMSQICQTVIYDQLPVITKLGAPSLQTLFVFMYPDFVNLFFPGGVTYEKYLSWLMDMSIWVNGDPTEGFNTVGTEFNPAHLAMITIMRARKTKRLPGVTGMLFADAIRGLFNKIEADALQADLNVLEMVVLQNEVNIIRQINQNLEGQALVEEAMFGELGIIQEHVNGFALDVGELGAEVAFLETAIGENIRYQAWIDLIYEGYGMALPDGLLSCLRLTQAYADERAALLAQGGV